MPAGKPDECFATHFQIIVVQGTKQRLSQFGCVGIRLGAKAENSPTAHFSVHISRQADQAGNRRRVIMTEKSKSDAMPNMGIGMIGQCDKVRDCPWIFPVAKAESCAIDDIGIFIGQQANQFCDRLVQELIVAPTKLPQNISAYGTVRGILAAAVLKTNLKLLSASSIVNSRQTRFRLFVTIGRAICLDDDPTRCRIAFTSRVLSGH